MNSPKQYIKTLITVYNSWIADKIDDYNSSFDLRPSHFELRTSNKVVVHVIVFVQQSCPIAYHSPQQNRSIVCL